MLDISGKRQVGTTALCLSRLGLGTAPLGNLFAEVSDSDATGALFKAKSLGVGWVDTAPLYGHGLSEQRLGKFMCENEPFAAISTKVGRVLRPVAHAQPPSHFVAPLRFQPKFDYSRDGIMRSFEDSLRRLGRDKIELVLLHDIDRVTHAGDHRVVMGEVLREALPTLEQLRSDGLVKAIGLGINEWDVGFEVLCSAQVDCVLLAGRNTLLNHTAFTSGFLETCLRRNVSVLAAGVFNSGLLAGGTMYDYQPADEILMQRRNKLKALCDRFGVRMAAAALQFSLAHPAVTSALVGARSATEVEQAIKWSSTHIPDDFWDELKVEGLLPADIPTPRSEQQGHSS